MADSVKVSGIADVQRQLSIIPGEFRRATRNALNDLARDIMRHLEGEIPRTFDRPTRIVQRPFYFPKDAQATKEKLSAELRVKDAFKTRGGENVLDRVLTPHIPTYPANRGPKGLESYLRRKGLLLPGQFLMPARTMRLDRYGNVAKSAVSRMISDLGGRSDKSARYIWATLHPKSGKSISGIWFRSRLHKQQPGALAMLAVSDDPTYSKRFRIFDIAQRHADMRMPVHLQLAVEHAFRRSNVQVD
jgi:hypothetical protein